jgi:hypothetical protein
MEERLDHDFQSEGLGVVPQPPTAHHPRLGEATVDIGYWDVQPPSTG